MNPLSSCLSDSELERLLAGAMAETELSSVHRHLNECPTCRGRHLTRASDVTRAASDRSPGPSTGSATLPTIEGYEIIAEISRGGQGVVYRAIQRSPRRTVAIKVLREAHFAGPEERARFEREVQVLGALKHPNIVTIYESGTSGGHFFYVMDYVEGQSLNDLISPAPLAPSRVLPLFIAICDAVHTAHLVGVIHRDLKPANIRLDAEGRPRILDFGLAKITADWDSGETVAGGKTISGCFLGSLPWASPEQAEGRPDKIDARTDVYSLGVVLFQMLTGRFPYRVDGPIHDVTRTIAHDPPQRPRSFNKTIERDLETIILKCLDKDPARRYQSAGDLARDLRHYLAGEPIDARRDSSIYLVRRQSRRFVQRHPIASTFLVVAILTYAGKEFGFEITTRWTNWNSSFERWVSRLTPAASPVGPQFQMVRVVGLNDQTDVHSLAANANLSGITDANKKSWRRLHGAFMQRLARSKSQVVAWDIGFSGQTEFDTDFVQGVRALRDAGIDVVVAAGPWWLDDPTPPKLSPVIRPEVRWGSTASGLSDRTPWRVGLVAHRGLADPLPSLSLAAFASYRQPGMQVDIRLDSVAQAIDLLYWTTDPSLAHAKRVLKQTDHIRLGVLRKEEDFVGVGMASVGLTEGDTMGLCLSDVPQDSILTRSTLTYQDVFTADESRLRGWFAGKIILMADLRKGVDRHKHPDGRLVAGCYAHAAAIESLFTQIPIHMSSSTGEWLTLSAGGLLGALVAIVAQRLLTRSLILLVLSVLIVVLTVATFKEFHLLIDPFAPLMVLFLSEEASAWVFRVHRMRTA